jgi:hypothetical protein
MTVTVDSTAPQIAKTVVTPASVAACARPVLHGVPGLALPLSPDLGLSTLRRASLIIAAVAALAAASPVRAAPHACRPVYNLAFLDGSRLEGADIVHVRADRVRCRTARRVAYAATKRGIYLGAVVLHYRVRVAGPRWRVDRNLSGDVDRYRARTGGRTVSWRLR